MLQYGPLAGFGTLLLAIIGAALRNERRLTRIETTLSNHLAHHEGFEEKLAKVLETLIDKK